MQEAEYRKSVVEDLSRAIVETWPNVEGYTNVPPVDAAFAENLADSIFDYFCDRETVAVSEERVAAWFRNEDATFADLVSDIREEYIDVPDLGGLADAVVSSVVNQTAPDDGLRDFVSGARGQAFLHDLIIGLYENAEIPGKDIVPDENVEYRCNLILSTPAEKDRYDVLIADFLDTFKGYDKYDCLVDRKVGQTALSWLAVTQGTDLVSAIRANAGRGFFTRDGFADSLVAELDDYVGECQPLVTFAATLRFSDIVRFKESGVIGLPASTLCGLFAPGNGMGCDMGIVLERPVAISKENLYELQFEGVRDVATYGYTLGETYMLASSAWDAKPLPPDEMPALLPVPGPFSQATAQELKDLCAPPQGDSESESDGPRP